jgi:tRNA 2-thiocytidine biosynthesis protein TtcA
MPPKYRTDDGRFSVIRPLLECAEEHIKSYAEEQAFPILPCNLSGSQENLKRDRMTALLSELEKSNPHLKSIMMTALSNVAPSHLLDREVADVWQQRPAHVRPLHAPLKPKRMGALPVFQSQPTD